MSAARDLHSISGWRFFIVPSAVPLPRPRIPCWGSYMSKVSSAPARPASTVMMYRSMQNLWLASWAEGFGIEWVKRSPVGDLPLEGDRRVE